VISLLDTSVGISPNYDTRNPKFESQKQIRISRNQMKPFPPVRCSCHLPENTRSKGRSTWHAANLFGLWLSLVERLTDVIRFFSLMHGAFRNFEEINHLQVKGHLEEDVWRGWEAAMRDVNGYPGVQAWWRLRSHWFREKFVKFIDQVQQTAGPPRLYREPMKDE
jgi:hypothetical protein